VLTQLVEDLLFGTNDPLDNPHDPSLNGGVGCEPGFCDSRFGIPQQDVPRNTGDFSGTLSFVANSSFFTVEVRAFSNGAGSAAVDRIIFGSGRRAWRCRPGVCPAPDGRCPRPHRAKPLRQFVGASTEQRCAGTEQATARCDRLRWMGCPRLGTPPHLATRRPITVRQRRANPSALVLSIGHFPVGHAFGWSPPGRLAPFLGSNHVTDTTFRCLAPRGPRPRRARRRGN
jgi:hypothetical protein